MTDFPHPSKEFQNQRLQQEKANHIKIKDAVAAYCGVMERNNGDAEINACRNDWENGLRDWIASMDCEEMLNGILTVGKTLAMSEAALHRELDGIATEHRAASIIAETNLSNVLINILLDRLGNGHYNCEQMTWQWGKKTESKGE